MVSIFSCFISARTAFSNLFKSQMRYNNNMESAKCISDIKSGFPVAGQ